MNLENITISEISQTQKTTNADSYEMSQNSKLESEVDWWLPRARESLEKIGLDTGFPSEKCYKTDCENGNKAFAYKKRGG